ncbi:hypothetical protein SCHPADRAFT_619465 [Schizopora paradoxa]|uniref:Uncharacterized protein n=1 Tax=Schizopora paradoxa TaxID=27342 RepID=A0A0H2R8G5_9AGAM|nr:hypothetical protein SCHPADRAFT_619465 [Schizopora paradoxa]
MQQSDPLDPLSRPLAPSKMLRKMSDRKGPERIRRIRPYSTSTVPYQAEEIRHTARKRHGRIPYSTVPSTAVTVYCTVPSPSSIIWVKTGERKGQFRCENSYLRIKHRCPSKCALVNIIEGFLPACWFRKVFAMVVERCNTKAKPRFSVNG